MSGRGSAGVLVLSGAVAGPVAVAVCDLLRRWQPPDPQTRAELVELVAALRDVCRPRQTSTTFDPAALADEIGGMETLLVTMAQAARMLSCSEATIGRRVRAGELVALCSGHGVRVTTASLRDYVARGGGPVDSDNTDERPSAA